MKNRAAGFSLVELLVVFTIIGVLLSVLYFNIGDSTKGARDAERKADLRNIQAALELYKNREGRYPEGCRGPDVWSGQNGSGYPSCPAGKQYIVGLAPKYIPALPNDPKLNEDVANSGYLYTTNADGTVYKMMVKNTVEFETVDYTNEFKSCDATSGTTGMCDSTLPANSKPTHCLDTNSQFQISYAVWGGYANPTNPTDARVEEYTEDIICDLP